MLEGFFSFHLGFLISKMQFVLSKIFLLSPYQQTLTNMFCWKTILKEIEQSSAFDQQVLIGVLKESLSDCSIKVSYVDSENDKYIRKEHKEIFDGARVVMSRS